MSEIANNRVSPRGHAGVLNGTWIGLREITGHAYLIARLTCAELLRDGAGLLLGEAWWVADPLLQMLIYSLVVGVIFARSLPDYPLFVLSALLAWKALASTISSGCTAITGNERIVRQVAFPRLVLPVAVMFSEFARFVIGMGVLVLLMAVFWRGHLSPALLWLPVLVVAEFVLLLPFAIAGAAATVFVRDLANLVRHILRIGFYLSPVLYGLPQLVARLPDWVTVVYRFNPLAQLLEGFRQISYYGVSPGAASILFPIVTGLVLVVPAGAWFRRHERSFAKVL